jgi:hypothetical protein
MSRNISGNICRFSVDEIASAFVSSHAAIGETGPRAQQVAHEPLKCLAELFGSRFPGF